MPTICRQWTAAAANYSILAIQELLKVARVAVDSLFDGAPGIFRSRIQKASPLYKDGFDPDNFQEDTLELWSRIVGIREALKEKGTKYCKKLLERLEARERCINNLLMAPNMPSNEALHIVREYANLSPVTSRQSVKRSYILADSLAYKEQRLRKRPRNHL